MKVMETQFADDAAPYATSWRKWRQKLSVEKTGVVIGQEVDEHKVAVLFMSTSFAWFRLAQ